MKKTAMVLIFLLLTLGTALSALAQDERRVLVRVSEYEEFIRVVFESQDEALVKGAKVSETYSLIRVTFPDSFVMEKGSIPDSVRVSQTGNSLNLTLKNVDKLKTLLLPSPPRLVVDAYVKGAKKPANASDELVPGRHSIVLDAGHGGSDPGIASKDATEASLALSTTTALAKALEKSIKGISLTRKDSSSLTIEDRIGYAQKEKATVFVSIHLSMKDHFTIYTVKPVVSSLTANDRFKVDFIQITHVKKSKLLAERIADSLRSTYKTAILYAESPLPLLFAMNCPAVLIELPKGGDFPYNAENIQHVADAIAKGIVDYVKK